ncbi:MULTISPECIES: hypothetical protein [unclassified Porphyromonas]|uniref:hypothetical protein n=1 Tax=unclassified Porphyromonas TaxID=2645799 RepID=UPI00052E08CF|nr:MULTISPECIES: hypothetical protein [unclassified Porphyromonas]KGN83619.1 hypothetical protein HQ41_06800 [Porphyromonas sp. COT-290 OH860]KGO01475.1 hypothetical protein HQ48_01860 [Porphyromonas sp. COT-290 OH3588]
MAYKRPLTRTQSIIIAVLWFVFVGLYLSYGKLTAGGLVMLLMSAFIVFYPIVKSLKQRRGL